MTEPPLGKGSTVKVRTRSGLHKCLIFQEGKRKRVKGLLNCPTVGKYGVTISNRKRASNGSHTGRDGEADGHGGNYDCVDTDTDTDHDEERDCFKEIDRSHSPAGGGRIRTVPVRKRSRPPNGMYACMCSKTVVKRCNAIFFLSVTGQ